MEFQSDELWGKGDVEDSHRKVILKFLKENPDTIYTENEVAEQALDEARTPEPGDELGEREMMMQLIFVEAGHTKAEIVLEQLVDEGEVEKRLIPISDVMEEIGEEARQQGIREDFPEIPDHMDFGGHKREFYRLSQN